MDYAEMCNQSMFDAVVMCGGTVRGGIGRVVRSVESIAGSYRVTYLTDGVDAVMRYESDYGENHYAVTMSIWGPSAPALFGRLVARACSQEYGRDFRALCAFDRMLGAYEAGSAGACASAAA